ncbi:hypothetical protein [Streptomyces sp. NPDC048419]|uniref:hypothetical protein n=1 Tax=Streptomyces sp. NPDC048419 TaxID=3365547 RepID=UPI003710793B
MRERMELGELLRQQRIDLSTLEHAPASPTARERALRVKRPPPWPCVVCGNEGAISRPYTSPEHGPRWVDLCMPHAILTWPPAPGMPTTTAGILADLQEVAAERGLTVRILSEEEFEEMGRRARERRMKERRERP